MIKDADLLNEFEKSQIRGEPPDFRQNLIIYEALFREATAMGIFPLKDPLDGIDVDIRLARVLNVRIPT
ncbi:MAG: hypothetical protein HY650_02550 [Acidobacteria bacterium]|nr:hypothetical protein [Acidobacteriota bacterium]